MADIVNTVESAVTAPLKGATKHPLHWAIGITVVALLAWRFSASLKPLLYGLPVIGPIFAKIAGDA